MVLTRLDLLQGFAALFQSLNRQDRDAILGVTFTRRAHQNDDWRTELNAFWQTWVDRMDLALPDLMVAQTHTRASLFSFSRQMQGSREPLVSLLEGLLDGENMNVMLRGVYLTSGFSVDRWMIYSPSLPPASTGWAITHWRPGPWWTPRLISPAACSRSVRA